MANVLVRRDADDNMPILLVVLGAAPSIPLCVLRAQAVNTSGSIKTSTQPLPGDQRPLKEDTHWVAEANVYAGFCPVFVHLTPLATQGAHCSLLSHFERYSRQVSHARGTCERFPRLWGLPGPDGRDPGGPADGADVDELDVADEELAMPPVGVPPTEDGFRIGGLEENWPNMLGKSALRNRWPED